LHGTAERVLAGQAKKGELHAADHWQAGSLRRVTVSDSVIEGVPGPYGNALNGIRVEGMTQAGPEPDDPVIDDVLITRNRFGSGLLEGVDIAGYTGTGATSSPPPGSAGSVRNVRVTGNVFSDCPDVCVLGISALAIGSDLANVTVSGIQIVDNDMATRGSGVYLVGGYTIGGGATRDNLMRGIEIRGNRIRPGPSGTCSGGGVVLVGDVVDLSNGPASGGRLEDATVADNDIQGCFRGILVSGAASAGTAASAMNDNTATDIRIICNRLAGNATGIHLSGGYLSDRRLLGNSPTSGNPGGAVLTDNAVRGVSIDSNVLIDNALGLLLTGGAVIEASGNTIANNQLGDVGLDANRFENNAENCLAVPDYRENSNSVVTGNNLDGVSCP